MTRSPLVSYLRRIENTADLPPNLFRGLRPAERFGVLVPMGEEALSKLPRRIAWFVITANQRSTRFSHEALVGVKCIWKRGCSASHSFTLGCLCVP